MWTICKTFNILPNDPKFQELNPTQLVWILENINLDIKEQNKLFRRGKNTEVNTFESTNFDEILAQRVKK